MKTYLPAALPALFSLSACAGLSKKALNSSDPPKLLKPVVRKVWIAPEIRNGGAEYVEGHYIYKIDQETKWSR